MANQSKSFYLQEIKKYKGDIDKYNAAISKFTNDSEEDRNLSMKALDEYRYEERNKNNKVFYLQVFFLSELFNL